MPSRRCSMAETGWTTADFDYHLPDAQIAQHPSAAHRLSETLDKIRKGSDARTSKLASVRLMTTRSAEAAS